MTHLKAGFKKYWRYSMIGSTKRHAPPRRNLNDKLCIQLCYNRPMDFAHKTDKNTLMHYTAKTSYIIACVTTLFIGLTVIGNADEPMQSNNSHLSHTLTPMQCGNQDISDSVHIELFIPAAASSATPFIHCNGWSAVSPHPSAVEIVEPTAWEARGDDEEGKLYLCKGTLDSCKTNYEP